MDKFSENTDYIINSDAEGTSELDANKVSTKKMSGRSKIKKSDDALNAEDGSTSKIDANKILTKKVVKNSKVKKLGNASKTETESAVDQSMANKVHNLHAKVKNTSAKDAADGSTSKIDANEMLTKKVVKNSKVKKLGNASKAETESAVVQSMASKVRNHHAKIKNTSAKENVRTHPPVAKKKSVAGPSTAGKARNSHAKHKNTSAKEVTNHPPVAEMVLDSIKALKKRKGASFDDIIAHIGENYDVNVKKLKAHITKFLTKSEEAGILEKITLGEKFKIKKVENVKKEKGKKREMEAKRKIPTAKKQRKM